MSSPQALAPSSRLTYDLRRDLIRPLPSQEKFLNAMYTAEYLLFGGAAGPGKSYIIRWALVELLVKWGIDGLRNVVVGLFCEDYPSLKDRQIGKIKREFPVWLGGVRDTPTQGLGFYVNPAYGGGVIALRNLDDPAKYASAEFGAIAVDELTKNRRQTFDDLRFRKRWPGIAHSPFLAATNPGSIGHAWVKKLWLDQDFSGDDAELPSERFAFIPALVGENPYLPESYRETLHSLPPTMRKAMEEGNWDLFVGQYFTEWNRDLHVCAPFPIPAHWRKRISIDYGYEAPSSVGWWADDPEGHTYRYRELYQRGLTYASLGREVMERTPLDERIEDVIADPAIWGDRPKDKEVPGPSGGEQLAELFETRGWSLLRGNHDRIPGWQRCRERLKPYALPDGRVGTTLHIFSTCAAFIRTVQGLVHSETRPEDLDTKGEDHVADEWRYKENTQAEQTRQEQRERGYALSYPEIPANHGISFAAR